MSFLAYILSNFVDYFYEENNSSENTNSEISKEELEKYNEKFADLTNKGKSNFFLFIILNNTKKWTILDRQNL